VNELYARFDVSEIHVTTPCCVEAGKDLSGNPVQQAERPYGLLNPARNGTRRTHPSDQRLYVDWLDGRPLHRDDNVIRTVHLYVQICPISNVRIRPDVD
jgi:hypothetical protein